ncbi:hypothetical protein BJ875DRAFT_15169 [Amylocarpus encephaloides]|uniref:Uncharacterized protein n=1 Tax=Amylocarpus encephaloides TaxID=45428 RepID=A0A9P8C5M3_9HELO|nr:hypothetical protein BJ875DRAFT_15169 [Amylocarpus encephaloides]
MAAHATRYPGPLVALSPLLDRMKCAPFILASIYILRCKKRLRKGIRGEGGEGGRGGKGGKARKGEKGGRGEKGEKGGRGEKGEKGGRGGKGGKEEKEASLKNTSGENLRGSWCWVQMERNFTVEMIPHPRQVYDWCNDDVTPQEKGRRLVTRTLDCKTYRLMVAIGVSSWIRALGSFFEEVDFGYELQKSTSYGPLPSARPLTRVLRK